MPGPDVVKVCLQWTATEKVKVYPRVADMADLDPWKTGSRVCLDDDFLNGLKCFRNSDWDGALALFRKADEHAEMDDIYQNRYTSFHGLVRVCMGDKNGVKLCRKAAVGEQSDVEVYYNLALAEHKLGFRESAYMALRRGLKIDAGHPGLKRLQQEMNLRTQRGPLLGMSRDSFLGRTFGRLFRGRRRPYAYRGK
jgi:tetratricopeptide (TPR) repeat protein